MRMRGCAAGGQGYCTRFLRRKGSAASVAHKTGERLPALARGTMRCLCVAGRNFHQARVDYSCGGMFIAAHSSRAGP